jgi:SAM-dependent methyltransferase
MKTENYSKEFSNWDPTAYLEEYFPKDVDIEPVVKLIAEEGSKRLKSNAIAIDVGCGPTVCYWSALASHVQELYLSDYLTVNLAQIAMWLNKEAGMYDWSYYTDMTLRFEGVEKPSTQDVFLRETLSRSKVKGIMRCDISREDPVGISQKGIYDCVLSVCCADSITNSKDEWRRYMKNIFSLLKPGGVFLGSSMRNCTHYKIGDISYPAANVNEKDFKELMEEYGFKDIRVDIAYESRPIVDSQIKKTEDLRGEYDEVLLLAGTFLG